MRLICPNCDAQYDVPDDVIPEDGRDVQCSNCGHTWFQPPAGAQAPDPEEDAEYAAPAPDVHPVARPAADPAPEEPAAEPGTAPQRRKLDPNVVSVLREEAEREARVRDAERGSLESQPDLGLDDGGPSDEAELRARQARDRMARMRGETSDMSERARDTVAESTAAAAAASGSRREMLPDIEEINSTLRSSDTPRNNGNPDAYHEAAEPARQKGRSRRGFLYVIVIALFAIAVYLYADRIAEAVPMSAGPLESYVQWVDGLRGWLDAKVLQGLQWLDSMASDSGNAGTPPATDPAASE